MILRGDPVALLMGEVGGVKSTPPSVSSDARTALPLRPVRAERLVAEPLLLVLALAVAANGVTGAVAE